MSAERRTWGRNIAWRIGILQRRTAAIRLRMAGRTWQQVADQLGYRHRSHACQDVRRAVADVDRRAGNGRLTA